MYEDDKASAAARRIQKIKVWQDMADMQMERSHREDLLKAHRRKLGILRTEKEYMTWVEEDELDIEGDRLLKEINNYKGEHLYSTELYK